MTGSQRSLWMALIAVCALALPVLVYFGNALDAERRVQVMYFNALNNQQSALDSLRQRNLEYVAFREQAEAFTTYAGERGIDDRRWERHEVNVQRLDLGFSDLRTLLAEMDSSERAWFVPSKLEISVPARSSGDVVNEQGLVVPDVDPMYRQRVTVNLKGEFLVYQQ